MEKYNVLLCTTSKDGPWTKIGTVILCIHKAAFGNGMQRATHWKIGHSHPYTRMHRVHIRSVQSPPLDKVQGEPMEKSKVRLWTCLLLFSPDLCYPLTRCFPGAVVSYSYLCKETAEACSSVSQGSPSSVVSSLLPPSPSPPLLPASPMPRTRSSVPPKDSSPSGPSTDRTSAPRSPIGAVTGTTGT